MDEIILRFPHLAEQIFSELDNKSVAKCRDTNRLWQDTYHQQGKVLQTKNHKDD